MTDDHPSTLCNGAAALSELNNLIQSGLVAFLLASCFRSLHMGTEQLAAYSGTRFEGKAVSHGENGRGPFAGRR
jgi:hypothetical protein